MQQGEVIEEGAREEQGENDGNDGDGDSGHREYNSVSDGLPRLCPVLAPITTATNSVSVESSVARVDEEISTEKRLELEVEDLQREFSFVKSRYFIYYIYFVGCLAEEQTAQQIAESNATVAASAVIEPVSVDCQSCLI